MKIHALILTVTLALGGYGPIAWASPATLHIGSGYGTTCATGGCPIYNTEVNNIGTPVTGTPYTGNMDVYQNSGGASALGGLLLIFGVANDTSGTVLDANSLSDLSLIDSSATKTPINFTFSGYQGSMASGEEIYSFLANATLGKNYDGLSGMNNSNSFSNWAAADLAVDKIDVSNFGIYVFDLNTDYGASFGAKNFIDIALQGIPEGTFAVAYGESGNKAYGTPFTESGLVDQPLSGTPVPEPSSLLIFALGLALLVIARGAASIQTPRRV